MSAVLRLKYRLLPHAPAGQLQKKNDRDAGFDLMAADDCIVRPVRALAMETESVRFGDGSTHQRKKYERQLIRTGVQLEPEELSFFLVLPRSGFSSDYLLLMRNGPGLIDCEYRGELLISVYSLFGEIPIARGERIAQLVPVLQNPVELTRVDELNGSRRGSGGFGSSGIR